MSTIADRIRTAQDKDGMLRRALERIIQLYTDKSHFVYELLQNAEDAEAKSIKFVQYPDRLEVFHDGKPFTSANLEGLCDIGRSDKADNLNQIGEFGVGFKSVFGICDTVRLYSDPANYDGENGSDAIPFSVEIKDFTRPEDIAEELLPQNYTTRFVFPFVVGQSFSGFSSIDSLRNTLSKKLQNLGITTLLFMKHLELIEYQIEKDGEPITGEYLLEKTPINDHCLLVSALGISEKESTDQDSTELISYLKFSRKLEKYPQRTVDIAFPIKINGEEYTCVKAPSPYVSVYFPTETESKLDFIVQGPYRTTPNRSSIPADDEENEMLACETAALLRSSLLELKETGKLNMSFVKELPTSLERFSTYNLFLPLCLVVRDLFKKVPIIPTKSGEYVHAQFAKIARQEKLASLFSDELLTQLINDGNKYKWLPTFLTATNREYEAVFRFFDRDLKIDVVPPEELRRFFAANPAFLPSRDNDWLVELYSIFENIPAAFSKAKFEANMLTANIVKTSTGTFVAPCRREGTSYIPNVFLPSARIHSKDINFVNEELYQRCPRFFDGILSLQKPNEYEFIIKDIEKRYKSGAIIEDDQHIEDIKFLLKYSKNEDYKEEVSRIIRDQLVLHCNDGLMRSTYSARIFFPISSDGINIEAYYKNVGYTVFFIDVDYYSIHSIDAEMLSSLGVRNSIIIGEKQISGTYETGARGKQPDWWTSNEFKWKLSADALKEVLKYISAHPTAKDSVLKSQAIMKLLVLNENRLCGMVHIGGSIPNLENEPCEMIHIICGERTYGWDGKWVFTESGELVSPKAISKHDLSTSIYGQINPNSVVFELLGFKKTAADELDDLEKNVPEQQLDAYFKRKLWQRYGITPEDLDQKYGVFSMPTSGTEESNLPFPTMNVKNWDALKKHAAEMLIYADPVRYQERVRSIRVSNRPREAKAYLSNMYKYEGTYKYACQLCHETCSSFEATEIFLRPETELDPINLCLCPNCASAYRRFRSDTNLMAGLRKTIIDKTEQEVKGQDYVTLSIDDDDELWFTQTHFAEIQELLKLADEVKNGTKTDSTKLSADDEGEKSGLSVYRGYIGKTARRNDGFEGIVTDVTDDYLIVNALNGNKAGKEIKIQLSFLLSHPNVYRFS